MMPCKLGGQLCRGAGPENKNIKQVRVAFQEKVISFCSAFPWATEVLYLHVPVHFLEQGWVSLESSKGFTQTGGQCQNPRTRCPLGFHVLTQLLTAKQPTETCFLVFLEPLSLS